MCKLFFILHRDSKFFRNKKVFAPKLEPSFLRKFRKCSLKKLKSKQRTGLGFKIRAFLMSRKMICGSIKMPLAPASFLLPTQIVR